MCIYIRVCKCLDTQKREKGIVRACGNHKVLTTLVLGRSSCPSSFSPRPPSSSPRPPSGEPVFLPRPSQSSPNCSLLNTCKYNTHMCGCACDYIQVYIYPSVCYTHNNICTPKCMIHCTLAYMYTTHFVLIHSPWQVLLIGKDEQGLPRHLLTLQHCPQGAVRFVQASWRARIHNKDQGITL